MACGALFNLGILCIILSTSKLRLDPRNSFIVTLAFSDFFLCLFTSPLTLWYILEGHWPLGGENTGRARFRKLQLILLNAPSRNYISRFLRALYDKIFSFGLTAKLSPEVLKLRQSY
jgi:hypothetical protein